MKNRDLLGSVGRIERDAFQSSRKVLVRPLIQGAEAVPVELVIVVDCLERGVSNSIRHRTELSLIANEFTIKHRSTGFGGVGEINLLDTARRGSGIRYRQSSKLGPGQTFVSWRPAATSASGIPTPPSWSAGIRIRRAWAGTHDGRRGGLSRTESPV
jgi:hypothetical protein